jgi:hypothetical protein
MRRANGAAGQVLVAVLVALMVAATLVPLMVFYSQRESIWTAKQASSTSAFHLAEAGIEKGYLALTLSTQTWVNLQLYGTPLTNYHFDKEFTDVAGGTYAISITSGPDSEQATVISIGRDKFRREVRGIKAVYSNSPLGGVAIYAGAGARVDNQVTVEWGAVVSPQNIVLTGAAVTTYPQFWSAGSIDVFDTNSQPPNCGPTGCCQWHAYATNLPPNPLIDFVFYASSAAASSCAGIGSGASPANSCYYPNSQNNWDYTIYGKTIYINGNLEIKSPGVDIIGNTIVMGNVSLPNGVWGKGDHNMPMPTDAWKQYCGNWAHYQAFDAAAPAAFPGLNSSYKSATTITRNSDKLAFYGLLYVGGNFNQGGGGGGNSDIYGILYSAGSSTQTANSTVTFYYNAAASKGMQLTQIVLARVSWQDHLRPWPIP